MFNSLEDIYLKYSFGTENIQIYKPIKNYILNLFNNKIIDEEADDALKIFWNGIYLSVIEKNYQLMKKYFLMAILKGNSCAMNNLAYYYQNKEKDYQLMKKYYLMAIEKDNSSAIYNLGYYYQYIEKDYQQMKKYYLMAIERDNSNVMYHLGYHYQNIEKDYEQMKKYYLMAILKDNSDAKFNLGYYYQNVEKDYEQMKKYYLMAIIKGNLLAMNNLELSCGIMEFYNLLNGIENKNELIANKIVELESKKEIIIYNNKIRLFQRLNNYKQCALCLEENVLNIDLECGHEICCSCYSTLKTKCIYNFCK